MAAAGVNAAKLTYQGAKDLGLLGEIRRFSSSLCKPKKNRKAAKVKAGEVFTTAKKYIKDCPDNQGFGDYAQWWLGLVLELLVQWDRLDKNLKEEWSSLGTEIIRLKGAKWYKIKGLPGEFQGAESKISDWSPYQIGSKSADVKLEAELLLDIYTKHLEAKHIKREYEPAEGCCVFPPMKAFISFHSRAETMGRIRHSVHQHQFTQIYGAAGIGKTAMLVEIAKQIKCDFTRVVYVAVPRPPDIIEAIKKEEIYENQKKIARQLGVPIEDINKDEAVRAHALEGGINSINNALLPRPPDLFEAIKKQEIFEIQKKIASQLGVQLEDTIKDEAVRVKAVEGAINSIEKVFLILDDVWRHLDLGKIGIPTGEKVKFLIGTRKSDLRLHGSDNKIPVCLLDEKDGHRLLKTEAGLHGSESVNVIAEEVAKQCDGLPLALAVIGSTLSGSSDTTWKHALLHLNKSEIKKVKVNDDDTNVEAMCKVIEYSYQHLDSRTWQKGDVGIKEVPMAEEDGIARDIFRLCCLFPKCHDIPREDLKKYFIGRNGKLMSEVFDSAILRLSNWHLLESNDRDGTVRMHGIVRDVAVDIANVEDSAVIICGPGTTKLSEETVTSNKTVSVMKSNINKPDGFSEYMILSRISGIIREAAKVRTLLLRGNSSLKELPATFFVRMGDLTVLDLSESAITDLPRSMDRLAKVHTLVLNGCKDLKQVDNIAKLWGLRVLSLRENALTCLPSGMSTLVNLIVFEFSTAGNCKVEKEFFRGLLGLQVLFLSSESLSVDAFKEIIKLPDINDLRLYVNSTVISSSAFNELKPRDEFTIYCNSTFSTMSEKKNLHIKDLDTADRVRLHLEKAEHLIIENCFQPKTPGIHLDLTAAAGVIFTETKILHLKNCGKIKHLSSANSSGWGNLEVLELSDLNDFDGIFDDKVSSNPLKVIREITFRKCNKISSGMSDNLLQKVHGTLQRIRVFHCDMVKYIFHTKAEYSGLFPFLVVIDLRGLKILKAIWKWERFRPQETFAKLKEFTVMDCEKLVYVFTPDLAAMLTSLQKLTVAGNSKLEGIVEWNGKASLDKNIFEKVTHLTIQNLPKLQYFHGKETVIDLDWLSLVHLRLGVCGALRRFPIGKGSAPHMTLVDVTSPDDKKSKWYEELEKLEKDKSAVYKEERKKLDEENSERKKNESIIPPFIIRMAHKFPADDE